ncbi:MAG: hypothetical protein AAF628_30150 [Planctomycetota bacterium]
MTRLRPQALTLLLVSATALPAQTVILVSGGGDALQTAAASAAPGSIFVLDPGRYDTFGWTLPDCTIVAPQRATWVGPLGVATAANQLTLRGIDVVTGRRFGGYYYYPNPGVIASSGANLVLDDCSSVSLSAVDCTVAISNCRIGGDSTSVRMTNVDGVMTDTVVFPGYRYSSYGFQAALPAMSASNSRLRIERCSMSGSLVYGAYATNSQALIVSSNSTITVAECDLTGGPGNPFAPLPPNFALQVDTTSDVVLWQTTLNGPTSGAFTTGQLATAAWSTPGSVLTPGANLTARFSERAATPIAVVLSTDLAPVSLPFFAEPLLVFGTPNWAVLAAGQTDAQGDFALPVQLPATPDIQYLSLWLTGLFGGTRPFRSTAPLGGVIL